MDSSDKENHLHPWEDHFKPPKHPLGDNPKKKDGVPPRENSDNSSGGSNYWKSDFEKSSWKIMRSGQAKNSDYRSSGGGMMMSGWDDISESGFRSPFAKFL